MGKGARGNWWSRNMPPWLGGRRGKRSGYDAAKKGRHTADWLPRNSSANAELAMAAPTLRARSRDLRRNNPYAASALTKLASRIVGTGIRPRPKTGDPTLDAKVLALWDAWSAECCVGDDIDFYGLQYQAVLGMLESGDAFVRRRLRRLEDDLPVPLQLEVLEADLLDETHDSVPSSEGGVVIQGVEFDAIGRRTGYWLFDSHPGDTYGWVGAAGLRGSTTSSFIPAAGVIHLANSLDMRPGQVRGVPHLSAVARLLREIDDYRFAERTRKKAESCVVGAIDGGEWADGGGDDDEDGFNAAVDADGNPVENLQPGHIFEVRDGKRFQLHAPATVGGYNEYLSTELHAAAAGARMTYELMTGDLRGVNYSSMRGGRLDFHAWIESVQYLVAIPRLCMPSWRWFIETSVTAGLLPQRPDGYPVDWRPPRPALLDPIKEVAAASAAIRSGLSSLPRETASLGEDYAETLREQAEALELADDLGLMLDSDPRKTALSGTAQDYLRQREGIATGGESADESQASDD